MGFTADRVRWQDWNPDWGLTALNLSTIKTSYCFPFSSGFARVAAVLTGVKAT